MKFILLIIVSVLVIGLIILACLAIYFSTGKAPEKQISYGVTFSQYFSEQMGLDWQETYKAILDDLGVKKLRIISYWPKVEPVKGQYSFEDLDWQIEQAGQRGVEVILIMGRKVPRWPECHIPDWARELSESEQQERILVLIEQIVGHYKDKEAIKVWQIENEPFLLSFGECPKLSEEFLDREINLVRELDDRPILLTASGELSSWTKPAKKADIFGTTLYRWVWSDVFQRHIQYPIKPVFYHKRAQLTKLLTGVEKMIIVELQAETWNKKMPYETPLDQQLAIMNIDRFKQVIEYTQQTGFDQAYLWGAEWWYWLKTQQNYDAIWQEAKTLF